MICGDLGSELVARAGMTVRAIADRWIREAAGLVRESPGGR